MTDELQPSAIRTHEFSTVRRGYDRDEVDRFRASVADRVAELEGQLASISDRLEQLGIADPGELQSELETVAGEVDKILMAAREAAGGLRSRATEDAARWRSEAEREVTQARAEAQADAEAARGSAWEAAAAMLEETKVEADRLLAAADQDALFIRAQAEREALRLTGDARRDAEEELRAARTEGERMLIEARAESEATLATARQSAEAAQERTRALEARRGELMDELETARLTIGQVEQERETARTPATVEPVRPGDAPAPPASGSEWLDDDASVRIVPANLIPAAEEPVDADALAEEVIALQAAAVAEQEMPFVPETADIVVPDLELAQDKPVAVETEPIEATPEPDPAALYDEAVAEDLATDEPEQSDEPEEPEEGEEPEEREEPDESEPGEIAEEPAEEQEPSVAPEIAADEPKPIDGVTEVADAEPAAPTEIDSLFAKLREPEPAASAPAPEAAVEPQPDVGAKETSVPEATAVAADPKEAPESSSAAVAEPFEVRDRLLLPIQNRTLRTLKRRVVDLQNRVLEELRISQQDWDVDHSMFAAAFGEDLAQLSRESYVAGFTGAAELTGAGTPVPPGPGVAFDASADFVDGMVAAVEDALARTRGEGGGARQVSAAVSRVFRAWRTDEAERRVRRCGFRAYHEGLLEALVALDIARVVALAPGRPCGVCPARSGATWAPGATPPAPLPPATPTCEATVVPAR